MYYVPPVDWEPLDGLPVAGAGPGNSGSRIGGLGLLPWAGGRGDLGSWIAELGLLPVTGGEGLLVMIPEVSGLRMDQLATAGWSRGGWASRWVTWSGWLVAIESREASFLLEGFAEYVPSTPPRFYREKTYSSDAVVELYSGSGCRDDSSQYNGGYVWEIAETTLAWPADSKGIHIIEWQSLDGASGGFVGSKDYVLSDWYGYDVLDFRGYNLTSHNYTKSVTPIMVQLLGKQYCNLHSGDPHQLGAGSMQEVLEAEHRPCEALPGAVAALPWDARSWLPGQPGAVSGVSWDADPLAPRRWNGRQERWHVSLSGLTVGGRYAVTWVDSAAGPLRDEFIAAGATHLLSGTVACGESAGDWAVFGQENFYVGGVDLGLVEIATAGGRGNCGLGIGDLGLLSVAGGRGCLSMSESLALLPWAGGSPLGDRWRVVAPVAYTSDSGLWREFPVVLEEGQSAFAAWAAMEAAEKPEWSLWVTPTPHVSAQSILEFVDGGWAAREETLNVHMSGLVAGAQYRVMVRHTREVLGGGANEVGYEVIFFAAVGNTGTVRVPVLFREESLRAWAWIDSVELVEWVSGGSGDFLAALPVAGGALDEGWPWYVPLALLPYLCFDFGRGHWQARWSCSFECAAGEPVMANGDDFAEMPVGIAGGRHLQWCVEGVGASYVLVSDVPHDEDDFEDYSEGLAAEFGNSFVISVETM